MESVWINTKRGGEEKLTRVWSQANLGEKHLKNLSEPKHMATIHFGSRRPSVRNNVSNKQASALSFSKMRSQVGFTALRSWSCVLINGYCRSCFESSSGSCSFFKRFSISPIHEMFVVARYERIRKCQYAHVKHEMHMCTWCTHVVCQVRVGGEEKLWALCSTKMATC